MTPRRIALTIIGLLVFGTIYSVYDRLFGWIDGLPLLSEKMLGKSDSRFKLPPRATSPTIERLQEAFGMNAPETEPAFYPTQLEFRNGETSTVVAAGQPPTSPASTRVLLSPFSVAVFGKARPEHLRQPGEVTEISTFHSDKAILEFDRKIMCPADMSTAKIVRLELISDPEQTLPDPRKGRVHITNNQRSSDPNRRFLLRTVGPVFYRDSKAKEFSGTQPQLGPDLWTDAPIEIVDHSNVPHREGSPAATAPVMSEEMRNCRAVADILCGFRLPPPTITAVGMRVYLKQEDPTKPDKGEKKGGMGGVRRIELLEQVIMHLWMEGGQGMVGSEGKSSTIPEASPAAVGIGGGLIQGLYATRELGRDLLQIETRGAFAYDTEKNVARFDVLPQVDPNLTNDVRATKIPARPGLQTLFSQVLEIEFNGSPVGTTDPQPATQSRTAPQAKTVAKPAAGGKPPQAKEQQASGGGPKFKRLHAWTYTFGRVLTITSDTEQTEAYGQDLVRIQANGDVPESTRLTGSPLYAVQQRSVLTAGNSATPGVLISQPSGEGDRCTTVLGPGHLELYDAVAKANTLTATWQTSMVQTKERVSERLLDLYTFTDGAKIEDLQSDYWLKGKVIKLWMAPTEPNSTAHARTETGPGPAGSKSQLDRLQALGEVTAHSGDLDIDQSDLLIALFRDIPPPEPAEPRGGAAGNAPGRGAGDPASLPQEPASPNAGLPPPQASLPQEPGDPKAVPAAPGERQAPAPEQPKEPEKPKPPMKIKAKTINASFVRYPMPKSSEPPAGPPAAPAPGQNSGMKYQLERARCEGSVVAHQDPDDPSKPRGTDILGSLLLINSAADGSGSRLTVFGWDYKPGEVHNEGTSMIGPKVLIDQIHNIAVIEGRGSLVMPANSDLAGADKKADQKSEPIVVHFRDGMKFEGTKKVAEFFGKVNAAQGESWIICHTMQVILDRPFYFTQANQPGSRSSNAPASKPQAKGTTTPGAKGGNGQKGSSADEEKAKVEVIYCYPTPADIAETEQEKLVVYTQVEREEGTGKPTRRQQLIARELTLRAQVKDEGRGEPYHLVLAYGPGVARIWAPESKDDESTPPAAQGGAKPTQGEVEMKLTVVNFTTRMIGKDKGDSFKEATFYDNIHVINLPTDNPDLQVERHNLPQTAVQLTCRERLVVWTHKNPRRPDEPATQYMYAKGNAYLQNDEYDGWGEEIRSEGKVVWFDGTGLVPARIKSRFKASDNSGRQIRLDRGLNRYTVMGSTGGTFIEGNASTSDDGLKKLPPPPMPTPANKNQKPNTNSSTNQNQNQAGTTQGNPN